MARKSKKKRTKTTNIRSELLDQPKKHRAEVVEPNTSKHIPEVLSNELSRVPDKLPALTDGLSYYLETIKRYPLLSREEERKIAERYHKTRDPKDAETLVTSNLRFVVKIAAEYSQFGSKLIDLIQEGNIGLMHAVKEYNPYKGAKLITYAVWWIKGYIQDYLMKQHSMVKIGTTHNQRKLYYNLEKEKALIDSLGMDPTVKLLSDRLGVPEKDVKMMEQRLARKDMSLDQPLGNEDSSSSLLDFESTDEADASEQLIKNESINHLNTAITDLKDDLSDKEVFILENRLLNDEPLKLQEIGTHWGVSREAVRQMEARLMKKIKNKMLPS